MNFKKKAASVAAVLGIGALAIGGSSWAYFTDTAQKTNTFTVGNVHIRLDEVFEDNAHLIPTDNNDLKVQKEAKVTNTGSEPAYIRAHIAIPTVLDAPIPPNDATYNLLHFNYPADNFGAGKWNWKTADGNWDMYFFTSKSGVNYNVYVATYEKEVAPNKDTGNVIDKAYIYKTATNEDIEYANSRLGEDGWNIKIAAEAVQAEGFDNAHDALQAAFGTPTDTKNPFLK